MYRLKTVWMLLGMLLGDFEESNSNWSAKGIFFAWMLVLASLRSAMAAEYTVSPQSDLQKAADRLQPGDTLRLGSGTYRQSIVVRANGTKSAPVRIIGDERVEFTGLVELKLEWTLYRDGIYRAKVVRPVKQLFADGKLMMPARWPNMSFAQRWDNSKWPAADSGSRYGTMVDADLAKSNVDFTGCVAILNIGAWQTFRRVISEHGKGADHFEYLVDPDSRLHETKHPIGMDRYCIYGKAALDAPGEWYYDANSSSLYFYPPAGTTPQEMRVESKQLNEAIVIEDSRYVEVRNVRLHGTTLRLEKSSQCTLENVDITYGSTVANPFGPNLVRSAVKSPRWNSRKWFGETSVDGLTEVLGDDNVIRNMTVRFSEGPALTVGGRRNLIENCLFQDNDWQGLDYGFGIDLLSAAPVTVRYVTLDHCGGSEGLRLANHGPSLVEYCHLHHCGLRQSDGAIIQTSTAGVAGTEIRFNWIHDHNAFHWGGNGIRGDDKTRGLNVHHNVVWNCREKGIVTKSDNNQVYHNTCFDNSKIDILIPRNRLPGKTEELPKQNQNSVVYNNIGQVTGSWIWEKPKLPPYGKTDSNQDVGAEVLRDAAGQDFRPKAGSTVIDGGAKIDNGTSKFRGKAPDVGAHEFGGAPWKVGYQNQK